MRMSLRLLLVPTVLGFVAACTPAPRTAESADSTVEPPAVTSTAPGPESTVDTGAPPVGSATGVAAWCALIPPSLVEATLGLRLREPTALFTTDEIHCSYLAVDDGGLTIEVKFRAGQDHASFLAYRETVVATQLDPVLDLPGVGEEAFYSTTEFDIIVTHSVVARTGSVILILDAPGTLEQVSSLVNQVLGQLS